MENEEEKNEESVEDLNDDPISIQRNKYENLKKTNDQIEAEMLRAEILRAKIQEGGKSQAGQDLQPKVETPEEYAAKVMSGELE